MPRSSSRTQLKSTGRPSKPPIFGDLRPSQVITTFGPGSVVDLRNVSVVLAGTDFWTVSPEQEIDEPRLRSMLRVSRFYRPPVRSDGLDASVPSFVFPRYLRCPRCYRLGRYDRTDLFYLDRKKFRCKAKHEMKVPRGGPLAFPARFVVACSEGHLDDFPWFDYVHRGNGTEQCQPERLLFRESAQSAAVSDLRVTCELCRKWRSMEDAFGKRAPCGVGPLFWFQALARQREYRAMHNRRSPYNSTRRFQPLFCLGSQRTFDPRMG